jgi:hypothetical protein
LTCTRSRSVAARADRFRRREAAFLGCSLLTWAALSDGRQTGNVIVPADDDSIRSRCVVKIADRAFAQCAIETAVVIPKTMSVLGFSERLAI